MTSQSRNIEGNSSFDNSRMNNGVITDKYFDLANCPLNYTANLSNNTTNNIQIYNFYGNTGPTRESDPNRDAIGVQKQHHERMALEERSPLRLQRSSSQPRWIKMRSAIDKSAVWVYATYDDSLQNNWITTEIIARLGWQPHRIDRRVTELHNGHKLKSTGEIISLAHSGTSKSQDARQQRFQVIEAAELPDHIHFDILFRTH